MLVEYPFKAVWWEGHRSWDHVHVEQLEDTLQAHLRTQPVVYVSAQWFASPSPGERDPHWADLFVDLDDKENTGAGLAEARKVSAYWTEFGIEPEDQWWMATGSGGYHGYANGHALGARPSPDLTYVYKEMAQVMAAQLELTTLDLKVYTWRRLMRVEGSKHQKTGVLAQAVNHKEWAS